MSGDAFRFIYDALLVLESVNDYYRRFQSLAFKHIFAVSFNGRPEKSAYHLPCSFLLPLVWPTVVGLI